MFETKREIIITPNDVKDDHLYDGAGMNGVYLNDGFIEVDPGEVLFQANRRVFIKETKKWVFDLPHDKVEETCKELTFNLYNARFYIKDWSKKEEFNTLVDGMNIKYQPRVLNDIDLNVALEETQNYNHIIMRKEDFLKIDPENIYGSMPMVYGDIFVYHKATGRSELKQELLEYLNSLISDDKGLENIVTSLMLSGKQSITFVNEGFKTK